MTEKTRNAVVDRTPDVLDPWPRHTGAKCYKHHARVGAREQRPQKREHASHKVDANFPVPRASFNSALLGIDDHST